MQRLLLSHVPILLTFGVSQCATYEFLMKDRRKNVLFDADATILLSICWSTSHFVCVNQRLCATMLCAKGFHATRGKSFYEIRKALVYSHVLSTLYVKINSLICSGTFLLLAHKT